MPELSSTLKFTFSIARAKRIWREHVPERFSCFFGTRSSFWNILRIAVFGVLIRVALKGDSSPRKVYQ